MTQFCHFSMNFNKIPNLLTISRSVRALSVCFASHFDFNYAHICRLRHKICLSFTMGLKFANSTNRAQDHGYGWEPGPGQGSSSTTKVQDPWLCPCVCGYVGLDSFAWLGPFGYCGLGSLLRLTLWPSAGLIAGIRLWDFLQGPTGPMQCELNSLRLKGLRLAYCSCLDRNR